MKKDKLLQPLALGMENRAAAPEPAPVHDAKAVEPSAFPQKDQPAAAPSTLAGLAPGSPGGSARAEAPPRPAPPPITAVVRNLAQTDRRRRPSPQGAPPPRRRAEDDHAARAVYRIAGAGAVLWIGAVAAFALGARAPGPLDAPFLAAAAASALLPAAFILLFAYALRQAQHLAAEARAARSLSDELTAPAALAALHAGGVVEAVKGEIARAALAAADATQKLAVLRQTLAAEGARVSQAAQEAERSAQALGDRLAAESAGMSDLAAALDAQSAGVVEAMRRQSRAVVEASDQARAQAEAAEGALTARTGDLAAAAAAAERAAHHAAGDLGRGAETLGRTGEGLGQTMGRLGADLAQERERLAELSEALRADHEDVAARTETRDAQFAVQAAKAREGVDEVTAAAAQAAHALSVLIDQAGERLRHVDEAARAGHADLDAHARASLDRLADHVEGRRQALETSARDALTSLGGAADAASLAAEDRMRALREQADALSENLAESVRARIDELGEAAFEAGRRTDQALDARLAAARRAIEAASTSIEEAGRRSAARLEEGLGSTHAALGRIDELLGEVDARFARLPAEAQARADAVRLAVERGAEELTAAARRAAQETQAIDAAFQERVRRNYATLSEAVRLMGAVADAADTTLTRPAPAPPVQTPPAPQPFPLVAQTEAEPLRARVAGGGRTSFTSSFSTPPMEAYRPAPERPAQPWADQARPETPQATAAPTLRPRLRLTPTSDEATPLTTSPPPPAAPTAPAPVKPPAPRAAAAAADEGWTWKDLLSSMDDMPVDDEGLAERLGAEIDLLGLGLEALLPAPRIDEAARAYRGGGADATRDTVRRIAPAAVRRLSRRVLTDRSLRGDTERFLRQQAAQAGQASRLGEPALAAFLGSETGRTYLMLDAAVGDLG